MSDQKLNSALGLSREALDTFSPHLPGDGFEKMSVSRRSETCLEAIAETHADAEDIEAEMAELFGSPLEKISVGFSTPAIGEWPPTRSPMAAQRTESTVQKMSVGKTMESVPESYAKTEDALVDSTTQKLSVGVSLLPNTPSTQKQAVVSSEIEQLNEELNENESNQQTDAQIEMDEMSKASDLLASVSAMESGLRSATHSVGYDQRNDESAKPRDSLPSVSPLGTVLMSVSDSIGKGQRKEVAERNELWIANAILGKDQRNDGTDVEESTVKDTTDASVHSRTSEKTSVGLHSAIASPKASEKMTVGIVSGMQTTELTSTLQISIDSVASVPLTDATTATVAMDVASLRTPDLTPIRSHTSVRSDLSHVSVSVHKAELRSVTDSKRCGTPPRVRLYLAQRALVTKPKLLIYDRSVIKVRTEALRRFCKRNADIRSGKRMPQKRKSKWFQFLGKRYKINKVD